MENIIDDIRIWRLPLVKISDKHFHKDFYDVIILKNYKRIDRYKKIFRKYIYIELKKKGYKPIKKSFQYILRPNAFLINEIEMQVICKAKIL